MFHTYLSYVTQEIDSLTPNHIMNHPAYCDVSKLTNNSMFYKSFRKAKYWLQAQ